MLRRRRRGIARPGACLHGISHRKRRERPVCRRLLRRVHLSFCGRAQGAAGGCHRPGRRTYHNHSARRLQQHARQHGACRPRREHRRGLHRRHPADLLSSAGSRDRAVLDRYSLRGTEHGVHHLQHPTACRYGAEQLPSPHHARRSDGDRRKKLLHADTGH